MDFTGFSREYGDITQSEMRENEIQCLIIIIYFRKSENDRTVYREHIELIGDRPSNYCFLRAAMLFLFSTPVVMQSVEIDLFSDNCARQFKSGFYLNMMTVELKKHLR